MTATISWHRLLSNLASPVMRGTQHALICTQCLLSIEQLSCRHEWIAERWIPIQHFFFVVLVMLFSCHSTADPPVMWFLRGILSVWRSGAFGQEVQPQSRGDQQLGTEFEMDIPNLDFTFYIFYPCIRATFILSSAHQKSTDRARLMQSQSKEPVWLMVSGSVGDYTMFPASR